MIAMRPPVLVPPIMSKYSQGFGDDSVDSGYELLEDHERGQAAHAAAVEGKELDSVARHCKLYSQRF